MQSQNPKHYATITATQEELVDSTNFPSAPPEDFTNPADIEKDEVQTLEDRAVEVAGWRKEYPKAPGELFEAPERWDHWLKIAYQSPPKRRTRCLELGKWRCYMNIKVPGGLRYKLTSSSNTKENAITRASQHMLRRLRRHGILTKMYGPTAAQHLKVGNSRPLSAKTNRQITGEHDNIVEDGRSGTKAGSSSSALPLTTTHSLSTAPEPPYINVSPSNTTNSLLSHENIGISTSTPETNPVLRITRELSPPDPVPGSTRQYKGKLPSRFVGSSKSSSSKLSSATEEALVEPDAGKKAILATTPLRNERENASMIEATDALFEIYNYCASLSAVPQLNIHAPTSEQFTVNIEFRERDISVTALGSFHAALLDACQQFKAAAEEYISQHDDGPMPLPKSTPSPDNAIAFVIFHNDQSKARISFVKRPWQAGPGPGCMPEALFSVQAKRKDQLLWDPVILTDVKAAKKLCYISAAIHLANRDPAIFQQFLQSDKSSSGMVLRPLKPIPLKVESGILSIMSSSSTQLFQSLKTQDDLISDCHEQMRIVGNFFSRRRLSPNAAKKRNWILRDRYKAFQEDDSLATLRYLKSHFPVSRYRNQVQNIVSNNTYSIIMGATGSGKTTQVPQIIFDDAVRRGEGMTVNIICTQPRRIAATSVARRVAVERNEKLQDTVGYHIKRDCKLPLEGGITYCTTGVLTKLLQLDPDKTLDRLSHIIIDEAHQRDINIDFLMIMVKKAVESRQRAGKPIPKIVLMSATIETELFANYFGQINEQGKTSCPSITIPGRTFQVRESYLEDILTELNGAHQAQQLHLLRDDIRTQIFINAERSLVTASQSSPDVGNRIDWTLSRDNEKDDNLVPVGLVVTTIAHIVKEGSSGAILVFLPGMAAIEDVGDLLRTESPLGINFGDTTRFKISILHRSMKDDQDGVFASAPNGCRKIILATNIAETSITIGDVEHVIDCGKHREKSFDIFTGITKLKCTWISKQNMKQRCGRAGRVQNGRYYALFSKTRRDTLKAANLPEILRSDLRGVCLSIKAQSFQSPIQDFLAAAIEPPSPETVEGAIRDLKELEAITEDEELTPLGRLLASLPLHPELGKLVVLGIIFRCLDSLLILGASKDEYLLFRPRLEELEADRAWRKFGQRTQSDPVAYINAFREARRLARQGLSSSMREQFLSASVFKSIDEQMVEIEEALVESGLIPSFRSDPRHEFQCGHPSLNQNCDNLTLLKALTFAGYRKNLAVRYAGNVCRTAKEFPYIQPTSVNFNQPPTEAELGPRRWAGLIYSYNTMDESLSSKNLHLRNSTKGSSFMAAIFGCKTRADQETLVIDEWLPLRVEPSRWFDGERVLKPIETIMKFRQALDRMLSNAFSSLQKRGRKGYLEDDAAREEFATTLIIILEQESQRATQTGLLKDVDFIVDADFKDAQKTTSLVPRAFSGSDELPRSSPKFAE